MRSEGAVLLREQPAPSSPAAGLVGLFAKSDKKLWTKDSAGAEFPIAASVPLARTKLGVAAASIDFQNIPSDFDDLLIKLLARGTAAAVTVAASVRFNNDSTAIYDRDYLAAAGASSFLGESLAGTSAHILDIPAASAPANKPGLTQVFIPGYSQTDFHKIGSTLGGRQQSTTAGALGTAIEINTIVYRATTAINRVTLIVSSGNFAAGTIAAIYGVRLI